MHGSLTLGGADLFAGRRRRRVMAARPSTRSPPASRPAPFTAADSRHRRWRYRRWFHDDRALRGGDGGGCWLECALIPSTRYDAIAARFRLLTLIVRSNGAPSSRHSLLLASLGICTMRCRLAPQLGPRYIILADRRRRPPRFRLLVESRSAAFRDRVPRLTTAGIPLHFI